jgi:hypothetical protein
MTKRLTLSQVASIKQAELIVAIEGRDWDEVARLAMNIKGYDKSIAKYGPDADNEDAMLGRLG